MNFNSSNTTRANKSHSEQLKIDIPANYCHYQPELPFNDADYKEAEQSIESLFISVNSGQLSLEGLALFSRQSIPEHSN